MIFFYNDSTTILKKRAQRRSCQRECRAIWCTLQM